MALRKQNGEVNEIALAGPGAALTVNGGTVSTAGTVGISLSGTIAGSGTITSALMPTYGALNHAYFAQITNAGTLSLQRYVDAAGIVPQGTASTLALTAATLGVLNVNDGKPALSEKVSIINGGTTAATISNFGGVLLP